MVERIYKITHISLYLIYESIYFGYKSYNYSILKTVFVLLYIELANLYKIIIYIKIRYKKLFVSKIE